MQDTPAANRPHIAVFGRRNAGKSSLINALTNQELALVSEIPGTTADPVYKKMELLPLGPVVMIDTAGIDDTGSLGELRIKKTREVMRRSDLALLVVDPESGLGEPEIGLEKKLSERNIPVLFVINKMDQVEKPDLDQIKEKIEEKFAAEIVQVSARKEEKIENLRDKIADILGEKKEEPVIIGDLISSGDKVILVTPIDDSAPKGRLILPQVQTIRDIIDHKGIAIVSQVEELKKSLNSLQQDPDLVVTDSQAFKQVDKIVPTHIQLTGFSILFARYKGDLEIYLKGIKRLDQLNKKDEILVAEGCTHRRQDEDIGRVKIPNWLQEKVDGELKFEFSSGREYPANLTQFDLIIHCGGCMLNYKEMLSRLQEAEAAGVPIINYGMTIAYLHGILDRALKPFPAIFKLWQTD